MQSIFVRLDRSCVPKLAHADPVVLALPVLLGLLGEFASFLESVTWVRSCLLSDRQRQRDRRQVRLVESIGRRRYAGRRLGWVRREIWILWAGLVLTWRAGSESDRRIARWLFAAMVAVNSIPSVGAFAVLATVGGRRLSRSGLAETLDAVDDSNLISKIEAERYMGRPGYPPRALWRAYLASFVLGMPSTNALIRRLQDDKELRLLCGFGRDLPHRTTFNRFISRLDRHVDVVQSCLAVLNDQLAELLPHLGERVAVDSTTVRSHSNPNRKNAAGERSDPDASWTAKNSSAKPKGKEWYWGYKLHLVTDATHDVPLFGHVTTAKRNDSPEMLPLLDGAMSTHAWLKPDYVMADKGYDALSNHLGVVDRGGMFISPVRRRRGEGKRTVAPEQAESEIREHPPMCNGGEMVYSRTDRYRGLLFRCRPEGCYMKRERPRPKFACRMTAWDSPGRRGWNVGNLAEKSRRWKHLYSLRQSVERVFKSLKESRRLEGHYIRGLRRIALHAAMSILSFSATYLVNLLAGESRPRWMVRRVA